MAAQKLISTDIRHVGKMSDRIDQSQEACSIRAGLVVIGQKIQWVDQ